MDIQALLKKHGITPYELPSTPKLDLGDNPKPVPTKRTTGDVLLDTYSALGKGANSVVRTVGDIAQLIDGTTTPTFLQKMGQEGIDYWDSKTSEAQKQKQQNAQTAINAQNGEMAKAMEAVQQYGWESPTLLADTIVESIPSLLVGGVAGKGAGTAARMINASKAGVTRASIGGAAAAESILQGGQVGGDTMRDLKNIAGISEEEKISRARKAALSAGAASAATYAIPGSRTVENALMGLDNNAISMGANALKGFGGEAAQESIQGASGQMAQNYYTDKPIMQGVGEQVALGALAGGIMGGAAGSISGYKPKSLDAKLEETIINHESTKEALNQNALMQTPQGYDPEVDVGFTREAMSDTTPDLPDIPEVDHVQMFGAVLGEDVAAAKAEGEVVYAKAYELASQGAKPEQINTYLDNAITPSRDDIALTRSINGGEMTSSRFSGARIFDTLDRTIRTSIDRPDIARTNEELKATLKKNGLNKTLANAYVEAYAAKDPSLLYEYVMANTADLQAEVKSHIDNRMGEYKVLSDQRKAAEWSAKVPEDAVDLINHPKFAEHLGERRDVSADDARYSKVRTADLVLSHENNGKGYETVVQQPAQFDRNYAYDFEMTKKDVADIEAGRWNDDLVQKLRNDLERRDNDPLYNPEKNIETPSQRVYLEMADAQGTERADMNMALLEGRAKALGITADELIDTTGLRVANLTDYDGAGFIKDLEEAETLFQGVKKNAVQKEKRGIYNVQVNEKRSTSIMKDMMDVDRALKFERGVENQDTGKGFGALHIEKHIGPDKNGWVSTEELLNIGEAVRNVKPELKDGKRVYQYHNDAGDRFRLVIGDKEGGERVISFYSNRKAGSGNNTRTYIYSSPSEKESLHQKIPDVKLTEEQINGMVDLGFKNTGEMRSIIHLFKTADISTLPHELMHVFERTFTPDELNAVGKIYSHITDSTQRSEAIARDFEKFLYEGNAPTPELSGVFERFRSWLTQLWENIIYSKSRDFELSDDHREFYRALLGDREAAGRLAQRYSDIASAPQKEAATILYQRHEQTTERLKSLSDRWDDMIDIGFDKVGRALRGVDGEGHLKINPKSSNLLINAGQSIAEWARENVITNGSRTDAYLGVMDQFAQERGYLESEAAAFYKSLKEFDDVAISDPMAPGEMTSHGALLVRALGGDMDPSSLPSSLKPHYDSFRRIIDANAQALIDAGELAPEHAMENYLKRFYQQHIDPDRPLSVGKQVMDGKHARADIDFDARRELGQVEDAAYVITRTILDQRLQLTKSMMFQRLADRVSTDAPRDGFVKVPSSKASDGKTPIYGALAGRYVDRGTLKDLQGMYDFGSALDLIVRGMSPAVDYVKVNMTVKNPGTHVYNVVSNMTIAALDGHMSEVAQVINMAVNDKPKFEKLVKMANKMGMNSMLADMEADLAQKLGKGTHPITKIVKNLWAAEGTKVGDKVRAAYDWEDKAFKLAKFYHELKKNNMKLDDASLKSAWDKVNEIYVDHTTRLPKAIRNMDKSGIYPFMGYAWRSAPQVAKLVAKHPLKVTMLQTLMGSFGWSQIALMNQMFGYDDEKDPDAPGYTEGGVNMYGIKNYVKIGDDGKVAEYLNIGRAVPGMRFLPDKGNPYLLYMDGGFLLSILGATAGVSTHGKIYEEYDSNAMKAAKAASKISEYIVPPIAPFVIPVSSGDALTATGGVKENSDGSAKTETVSVGARYAQKLIQAANGSVDRYSQPIEVSDVLAQAVGAKTLKVDKVMERSSKLKNLMQELKRAISVDDSDRVEELAVEIRNLDLPDTKLTKPKDDEKKSDDKERKKKVDDELNRLGLAPRKQSSSITLPSLKPIVPRLDI